MNRNAQLPGAVFHDMPVAQRDHARATLRHVDIVSHDQYGRAEPLVQIPYQRQYFRTRVCVQITGRLIRQQDRRINGERASNGAALAFAAGKLVGQMVEARAKANQVEQFFRSLVNLLRRPASQVQGNRAVLQASQRRQQVEELKDEPDFVAAQARQFIVGEPAQPAAIDLDFSRCGRIEAANEIQQRGFPGTRWPHNGHHLASADRQIDVFERRNPPLSLEDFADVREINHLLAMMSYRDGLLQESNWSQMRIGIDAGGTFTDFIVCHDSGAIETFKLRSNPRSPASVILAGLEQAAGSRRAEVIHGSTVATNALLERKGVRTALVTTAGFEDVIHIGRQNRAELYNLTPKARVPIIPRTMCFGLNERTYFDGAIGELPRSHEIAKLKARLRRAGVESIAICFLHAYRNPKNEKQVLEALEDFDYVCSSHEVCPEFREYERSSTTLINAYVGPLMDRYLGELEQGRGRSISIMQSNGGFMSTKEARQHAIRTVLSGPAGGVMGALETARLSGFSRILGFDMGGTSTDVSLSDGAARETMEASIDGFPVRVPMLDIHTVGAGGGSIARVDEGGLLRVGPESAGADPGPACYGVGNQPTVTDAHVVLGRIAADQLIGGNMHLHLERAFAAVDSIARQLGIGRVAAARGILRVANANMERAIRVVSVERGHDPRDFALVAFGGCGGLHACEIAAELGIKTVLVPEHAGALSALGMLVADRVRDYAAGVLNCSNIEREFARLESVGRKQLPGSRLVRAADIRYSGQSYELTVPWNARNPGEPFHREHQRVYGYANPDRAVEIVTIRVRARVAVKKLKLVARRPRARAVKKPAVRRIHGAGAWRETPVYTRSSLPAAELRGPALVIDYGSTTLVPPGWMLSWDKGGNLKVTS
jgi:N-methylhydantoinase A